MVNRNVRSVALSMLLVMVLLPAALAQRVRAVEKTGFTVADMDRSLDFFVKVLTFSKVSDREIAGETYEKISGVFGARVRIVELKLGEEMVELTEYLTPKGRPIPPDMRANDQAFQHIAIIVSDMDRAYARLRQFKVQHASTGPQTLPVWNKGAAGIRAFYFRDPDGHFLELLSFPADKGLPKWHAQDRLFLGIDHTAIVVRNTDESLRLYRDLLGLKIVGEGENYGTEQEHLNNVFGARLRITSLRAAAGAGIELLEYLAPQGGRPVPADEKGNDLLHWRTVLDAADVEQFERSPARRAVRFVSPGLVKDDGVPTLSFIDADGHEMQLREEKAVSKAP
jgi:catechol 2,3-dioxygenase-like lactoylglutathione lyase family enzyme